MTKSQSIGSTSVFTHKQALSEIALTADHQSKPGANDSGRELGGGVGGEAKPLVVIVLLRFIAGLSDDTETETIRQQFVRTQNESKQSNR